MALTRPFAEQGQAWAQNALGWMYAEGKGVSQDDKEAVRWYRKAAVQGHAGAQITLGLMYRKGVGVRQDLEEAAKFYRQACDGKIMAACFDLGVKGCELRNQESCQDYAKHKKGKLD